jgi:hypothetical protein
MGGIAGFERRVNEWCAATGLKRSSARHSSVFNWMEWHKAPEGFDHTRIFYYPEDKLHIMITEPYWAPEKALKGILFMPERRDADFSFAVGPEGAGLWYPGECRALIVARPSAQELIEKFASLLPTK